MTDPVPSKERDAFEAWAVDKFSTHRHAFKPERYLLDSTNLAWKAWQAGADNARRASEYWKSEHLAGNAEIDRLNAELADARLNLSSTAADLAQAQADGERLQRELVKFQKANADLALSLTHEPGARYPHWTCKTHGDFDARVAVGCPECVRAMREQLRASQPPRDEQ